MGTIFTPSSPKSTERPEVLPDAAMIKQLCGLERKQGTLKVSNMT